MTESNSEFSKLLGINYISVKSLQNVIIPKTYV